VPPAEYKAEFETDPRFPSGKWVGFYLMPHTGQKRHQTELVLNFLKGRMWGDGQDKVGKFIIEGKYTLEDGKAHWLKTYISKHTVHYAGYNEGKGIWGIWEIPSDLNPNWRGGFHVWPDGVGVGSDDTLKAALDMPSEVEDPTLVPV
jgi:hypothetical protein